MKLICWISSTEENECIKVISFLRLFFFKLYMCVYTYMWKILWYDYLECNYEFIVIWDQYMPPYKNILFDLELVKKADWREALCPSPVWLTSRTSPYKDKEWPLSFLLKHTIEEHCNICFIYFSFRVMRIIYIYLFWLNEILLKIYPFFVLYYFTIISHACSSNIRSCPSILINSGYESVDIGLRKAQKCPVSYVH